MKRMITTAGLAALGAASFAPAFAQDVMTSQKPWSVGALLRGFYDDNYFMYPGTAGFEEQDSFGFDISPMASINLLRDQTSFEASYIYQLRYFIDRPSPKDDHSHVANLKLSHAFNEKYSVDIKNSFAIAQEPSVIDDEGPISSPLRTEGDNIRNSAGIEFKANFVERFGMTFGYNNTFYDYEEDADDVVRRRPAPIPIGGGLFLAPVDPNSRSSVLDRMEHLIYTEGNFNLNPKVTLTLGYDFRKADFTSRDPVVFTDPTGGPGFAPGSEFDRSSHAVTAGAKLFLNPQVQLSGRAGVEITTYDNEFFDDQVGPFAAGDARWTYAPGSALQAGVSHKRISSDIRADLSNLPVADAEATTVWVSVTHAITAKISAIAMGQFQHNTYGESTPFADELVENIFYGGVTLAYQFNEHIAAEVGYSYDRLDSDLDLRSFTRNRVFIGTRLRY